MLTTNDENALSGPDTKRGKLQRAILLLVREHEAQKMLPTNGRFIFYEATQRGFLPKKHGLARSTATELSEALTWLREEGLIQWAWIVDETRELKGNWGWSTIAAHLTAFLGVTRLDPWDGELPPAILCESRAVGGVIQPTCDELRVPLAPIGGQCKGFLVTEVAPLFVDNDREVFYIGDCEVGGPAEHIEKNARETLEKHAGRPIRWTRLALTPEQIVAEKLEAFVIHKVDNRYDPPKPYEAFECEAIGQATLIRLLRDRLEAMLPRPMTEVRAEEERQRAKLRAVLARA